MAESLYTDPRFEALGLTDTTQARAADRFYNSMPQFNPMGGYGQMGEFDVGMGFMDEDDLRAAYENDIISRLQEIDPSTPDYEYRVQEFFATIPDKDAANYPRVQRAASALMGRSSLLREQSNQQIQEERQLRSQLAEMGFSPDRFSELMTEDGRLDLDRAYFQLGELKRTNGESGKVPEGQMSYAEQKDLESMFEMIPKEGITDDEKRVAFKNATGRDLRESSVEDWEAAYRYAEDARYSPVRNYILNREAFGRKIPDRFKQLARMPISQVESTVETQSTAIPEQAATQAVEQPVNVEVPPVPSENRFLSAREAEEARKAEEQRGINQQWDVAKSSLRADLEQKLGVQPNEVARFWELLERNDPVEIEEEEVFDLGPASALAPAMAPTTSARTAPAIIAYLRKAGIDPRAIEPNTKRTYFDVAKALAEDMVQGSTGSYQQTSSGARFRPIQ